MSYLIKVRLFNSESKNCECGNEDKELFMTSKNYYTEYPTFVCIICKRQLASTIESIEEVKDEI